MSEYLKDKFMEDFGKFLDEKKTICSYNILTGEYVPSQVFEDYIIRLVQKMTILEEANAALNHKVEQLGAEITQMKECFEKTKYFNKFKGGRL